MSSRFHSQTVQMERDSEFGSIRSISRTQMHKLVCFEFYTSELIHKKHGQASCALTSIQFQTFCIQNTILFRICISDYSFGLPVTLI